MRREMSNVKECDIRFTMAGTWQVGALSGFMYNLNPSGKTPKSRHRSQKGAAFEVYPVTVSCGLS
jgi:hypothetical protein